MDEGADSLAKNTPNAQKFICPICLSKPKRILMKKGFIWASVVRGRNAIKFRTWQIKPVAF